MSVQTCKEDGCDGTVVCEVCGTCEIHHKTPNLLRGTLIVLELSAEIAKIVRAIEEAEMDEAEAKEFLLNLSTAIMLNVFRKEEISQLLDSPPPSQDDADGGPFAAFVNSL